MSVNIRIPIPIDSNVNKVALQSCSTATGTYAALASSPFSIKTQSVWIRTVADTNGSLGNWYERAWVDEAGSTGSWSSPFHPGQDAYCNPRDVWQYLNKFKRVRQELMTTNGTSSIVLSLTGSSDVAGVNIIEGTYEIKAGTAYNTASELIEGTHYYLDLDNGTVVLTTAGTSSANGKSIWADYDSADLSNTTVRDIIDNASRQLEFDTGRRFNSGSYTEYFNVNGETSFFTKYYPHIDTPTVEENLSAVSDVASWTTRTAGFGADYLSNDGDKLIGRVRFIDNVPGCGTDKLRVTYNAGYVTIPDKIRRTAVLYAVKDLLINPAYAKNFMQGLDLYTNAEFKYVQNEIDAVKAQYRRDRVELV